MTLYNPGAIVLLRFPFSLLHTAKKRPAVVISPAQYFRCYGDLVVLALTSRTRPLPALAMPPRE
jgi:mRNA-degrading endonuclease toxin of MazEF toxin-antitoxin module